MMHAKRVTMCSPSLAAASWTPTPQRQAKKSRHDADALDDTNAALLEHDGILMQALQNQLGASLAPKPDPTTPLKPSKLFGTPSKGNQANAMGPLGDTLMVASPCPTLVDSPAPQRCAMDPYCVACLYFKFMHAYDI